MITGIIKNGRATVNVIFRLPEQPDFTIEFVIDTGFTEFLSLPPAAVNLLGFPFVYDMFLYIRYISKHLYMICLFCCLAYARTCSTQFIITMYNLINVIFYFN